MNTATSVFSACFKRVFTERENQHIVQWADDHYFLSAASSNGKGKRWKTHGYQKLSLHAAADLDTELTVKIKPVQIGESKVALIGIGYESVHRYRSNAIFLPRRHDADDFSNVQIKSMLEDVPVVAADLKTDVDKRDSDNTTRRRAFKGAQSYCRATQTVQDISSITVSTVWGDEVSKMPSTIKKGKGDAGISPVDGMLGRMDAEKRPCLNLASTPLEIENCEITTQFNLCREKFERYYECPCCKTMQTMEWGDAKTEHGFKWEKVLGEDGLPDDLLSSKTIYYQCAHCEGRWHYKDMPNLDDYHAEWRSNRLRFNEVTYKYYDLETGEEAESPHSVGIQLRGWMSRTKSWAKGCFQFLQASRENREGKPQKLINWTQDYKAEAYIEPELGEYVKHVHLMARQEEYLGECPQEVQAITGWWDLQEAGYIFGLYIGWGYDEECWLLHHTAPIGCPQTSSVMHDHIGGMVDRKFVKPNGEEMPVMLTGVDAGWAGHLAHDLSKDFGLDKIIPTFGGRKIGAPPAMMPRHPNPKTGTFLTEICVDAAKTTIYKRYGITTPGPQYIHIPDNEMFDEDFIKQMVAEKRGVENGVRRWLNKSKARNEALDCMVGNYALINLLQQPRFGLRLVPFSDYVAIEPKQEEDEVSIDDIIKAANA